MSGPEHPRPDLSGWQVHIGRVPVAIRAADAGWPEPDVLLLHDLAGGLAYGFDSVRADWEAAHEELGIGGYRLELQIAADDALPLTVGSVDVDQGVVLVTMVVNAEAFARVADADIRVTQGLMADAVRAAAISAGVPDKAADRIRAAWVDAAPTLAISLVDARTARPLLSSPLELDDAFASEAHKEIARRVRAAGIAPGTYAGQAAKELDRDVLAPVALELLSERLSRHTAEDLVTFAMVQAERAVAAREREVRNLEQSARTMTLDWDPVARIAEVQAEHLLLRRCIEVVVELVLRDEPTGSAPIDRLAWVELLSAAQTYLEATSRSEAVHHQVRPTAIEITDMYEIRAVETPPDTAAGEAAGAGRVYELDIQALQRARTAHAMAGSETSGEAGDPPSSASVEDQGQHLPGLSADVDAAMTEVFGASATDIITVLFALAQWPLSENESDAVVVDRPAVTAQLSEVLVFSNDPGGPERIEAAVNLLISRPAELRVADWRPWHARSRQRRLLVQPLPALRDDFIVVAPHFCLGSASVYINYLTQGLLPWSAPQPPAALDRALAEHRDQRNRQLEDDVSNALKTAGYECLVRVRETDPQRLGVPSLTGEIDAVAGRPGSAVIWLLEVKDPAEVFVVPEIRRHLDRFYVTRDRDKAYAEQLGAKLNDLTPYATDVASALGLPVADSPREIRPLFVTRRPVPAAFVNGPFPFATLPDLLETLAANEGGSSES